MQHVVIEPETYYMGKHVNVLYVQHQHLHIR